MRTKMCSVFQREDGWVGGWVAGRQAGRQRASKFLGMSDVTWLPFPTLKSGRSLRL